MMVGGYKSQDEQLGKIKKKAGCNWKKKIWIWFEKNPEQARVKIKKSGQKLYLKKIQGHKI